MVGERRHRHPANACFGARHGRFGPDRDVPPSRVENLPPAPARPELVDSYVRRLPGSFPPVRNDPTRRGHYASPANLWLFPAQEGIIFQSNAEAIRTEYSGTKVRKNCCRSYFWEDEAVS